MSAATLPRNAVAAPGSKKGLLGHVVWYGWSDAEVPLRTVQHHWRMAALPKDVLPEDTKALDAFKRAVTSLEGHHGIERTSNIHVDKVVETANTDDTIGECVYQVAFIVRDTDAQEATYPRACKFVFNKTTEQMRMLAMHDGVKRSDLLPISEFVIQRFDEGQTRVHGSRIRALIRDYLRSDYREERIVKKVKGQRGQTTTETKITYGLSGENMANGNSAIYFVKADHTPELQKLAEFVRSLSAWQIKQPSFTGSPGFMNMLGVMDGRDEREMLRRHAMANLNEAFDKAIAEAKAEIAKTRSGERLQALREDKKSNMYAECGMLLDHAKAYEHILQDELASVETKHQILRRQLDLL